MDVKSHTIHYGYIVDKAENIIDEVMVSVMKAPNSYTKEDTLLKLFRQYFSNFGSIRN